MSSASHTAQRIPIAVVGVSALFPGSIDKHGFWRDILAERDLIGDVPDTHWLIEDYYDADPSARDMTYAKRGGFLPAVDFDAMRWGVPPTILPATDSTQLLALIVAERVIHDACRGQFGDALRERTSVFLGVTSAQELLGNMVSRLQKPVWVKALREMGLPESQVQEACTRIADQYVEWQESTFPGVLGNVVAGRIANRLDLGGANCVTDAACASTFSALSMALSELRLGTSDLVIAGGADTMNDIFMYMCFSKTPALSPTGECRPFSDQADGTLLGEGIGMVALKRLDDAERDGDRVYAVLRGLGASSDGRSKSVYAPVAEGQARALQRAYDQAGYGPGTVGLVEAHGTGTKAGDAAEFRGLSLVFERDRDEGGEEPWCALGTIKAQIGHTKAAAGAAGLFKAIMALHHKVLPATLKVERPNPALEVDDSPFYLNAKTRPWIQSDGAPRRASVSSFGFGGSNFHVTLEEYAGADKPAKLRGPGPELVLLSAPTPEALVARCETLASSLDEAPEEDASRILTFVARDSQTSFDASHDARLAIVADGLPALRTKLGNAAGMVAKGKPFRSPTGITFGRDAVEGDVAFVFPGQGSQYVGMGADVAIAFDAARGPWDDAASSLCGGRRLHDVVFPRAAFDDATREAQRDALTATERAQPAIGTMSRSLLALLRGVGLEAKAVAGHSFGEVSALHAAGAIDATTAFELARLRGQRMADAADTPGAMLSVRASLEEVEAALPEGVVVANHNAPKQVVVSGSVEAIDAAAAVLEERGMRVTRLNVATAFHSPIVADAVPPLRAALAEMDFGAPAVPCYANRDAKPYPSDPSAMREVLAEQLQSRVRFVESIEAMHAAGVRTFVEVGPGRVLSGLIGRILSGKPHLAVAMDRKGRSGLASLWEALGQLCCAGHALDFASLWNEYGPAVDPRERTAMKMPIPISGTSYGKLYPPPGGAAALPAPNPESPAPRPQAAPAPAVAPPAPRAVAPAPSAVPPAPTPVPALPTPAPAAASAGGPAWLQAYEIAQRQAAEAQASFQQTLAQSHERFMAASEASWQAIAALVGDGASLDPAGITSAALPPLQEAPPPMAAMPMPTAPVPAAPAPAPAKAAVVDLADQVAQREAPAAAPAPPAAAVDLKAIILQVVAEATGYPEEMLGLDMNLEADLGIDSIKRVEILSALTKRVPNLPELPTGELAKLATLGAILATLEAASPAAASGITAAAPAAASEAPSTSSGDLSALVLRAVADKTGYPIEMLGLDMDMEADLGIDSIKRVEILSYVREQAPSLPDVPASELAARKTLGSIVALLDGGASAEAATPAVKATAAAPAATSAGPLRVAAPEWQPAEASGLSAASLAHATVVVVDDGAGVAPALVAALAARGVAAELASAGAALDGCRALIDTSGLQTAPTLEVLEGALARARTIAPGLTADGGLYVTVERADAGAALSPLCGLSRCARHEWPAATCRSLAVGGEWAPAALGAALAQEICDGGDEANVKLSADGARAVLRDRALVLGDASPGLGPEDVVLASGGARGVTADALIALARTTGARFALLGRSPLGDESEATRGVEEDAALKRALLDAAKAAGETLTPAELGARQRRIVASRAIRATIAAIEAAGGKARYLAVDVTDADAVRGAATEVASDWGPVTAIVHGAGVLADKRLEDKDAASFERVWRTKVDGFTALLEACDHAALRMVCAFSSVAARYGNAGQSDYAAANAWLNARATQLAAALPHCTVRALGWGPWRGGMVTSALAAHFESQGVQLIERDAGADAFVRALAPGAPVVQVIGASLPGPSRPTSPRRFAVAVDAARFPHLRDHVIRGDVVLPVAAATDLMVRALEQAFPALSVTALSGLRVLRGVPLPNFGDTPTWLTAEVEQLSNGEGATASVALLDPQGNKRYAATATLAPERAATALPAMPGLGASEGREGGVYGGVLFHGPRFQVIEQVPAIANSGLSARLRGAAVDDGAIDVGLVDGALQLALLWTEHTLKGASLPTAIEQLEIFRAGPVAGPVQAELRGHTSGSTKAVTEVVLSDADGEPIVRLRGVETHLLPRAKTSASVVP